MASRLFHRGVFPPDTVVTQMKAVIAPDDDDRVVGLAGLVESGQQFSDEAVDKADGRVVAVQEFPLLLGRNVITVGAGLFGAARRRPVGPQLGIAAQDKACVAAGWCRPKKRFGTTKGRCGFL